MIDLVRLARFAGARLILDRVTGIDREASRVRLQSRPDLPYDLAAIDIGITSDLPQLPVTRGMESRHSRTLINICEEML